MTITIIGHGYVGLVSACVFADFGNKVWVIGHTPEKLARLRSGDPIIYEPGLKEMLEKNLKAKRLIFTDSYKDSVPESQIIFITVGTPPKANGAADLTAVYHVAEQIAKHLKPGFTVISCKSTVPVGTNRKVEEIVNKNKKANSHIAVASCPEFLREGSALGDTLHPDRVIVGSSSKEAVDTMLELHKPISGDRVVTDLASAELIKYTSNSMLATKISFANLISFYCEKTGADVETVLDAVGLDKRIGRSFMYPGVGYGGSCFPKDVQALMDTGKNLEIDTSLLQAVENINQQARENFLKNILKHIKGKTIGVWGLSFKPDTDDVRFAPSVYVLKELIKKGFTLKVYDQVAMENIKKILGNKLTYANNPYEAVENVDALCIFTEWNEFKQIDLSKVKKLMKKHLIFDGRNIFEPKKMKKAGFEYYCIGRS